MKKPPRLLECRRCPLAILITSSFLILVLYSCNQDKVFDTSLPEPERTPREAYLAALDSNGLGQTQMTRSWRSAGVLALKDSILIVPPFQETGYFRAEVPAALSYRMELKRGELLQINLVSGPDSVLFFVDLFQIEPTDSTTNFEHLFSAENYQTDSLAYEVKKDGNYLLRIQPELLTSCRFYLQLLVQPIYGSFPVSGKANRDIWSVFGDPREGGKRIHKGIDIFARRGTPVIAATDGWARRVRERGRGGKQVWLYDTLRYQSIYYAHLDSQLVEEGQWVKAGDTIGLVGNTGNARNTLPHLHLGIYRRGYGAIDPYPFVAFQSKKVPAILVDTARLGRLVRVRLNNAPLMTAPQSRGSITLATLNRHLPLEIIAASKAWYRVRSPDGRSGYLFFNNLEDIDRTIAKVTLDETTELLKSPYSEAAPVSVVRPEEEVFVIGKNGSYQFVQDNKGVMGWVPVLGQ